MIARETLVCLQQFWLPPLLGHATADRMPVAYGDAGRWRCRTDATERAGREIW
ncbi:MAG: hypothetical protein R3E46_14790 [Sedimenticolaceae bacterium]